MNFLTTATITAWLKISGTDDNTVIDLIGAAVEDRVDNFLNRALLSATYTDELVDGSGDHKLLPKHFPITSVTALSVYDGLDVDGNEIWDAWEQNSDYDRLIIPTDKHCIILDGAYFPEGFSNIKLTYVAGYTTSTLPDDILKAMKDLCYLYYHTIRAERNLGKLSDVQITGGGLNTTISYDREAENKILQTIVSYRKTNV